MSRNSSLILGAGKKPRKNRRKLESNKKLRVKVKLKIKGSAVGVHNAIKKLASGGADNSGTPAPMSVEIKDRDE